MSASGSTGARELPTRKSGCGWGCALASGLVLLLIGCIALSIYQSDREARVWFAKRNLAQLQHALRSYHDVHGCFPPAYITDAAGRPMHSWRILVLPYLSYEYRGLYEAYNFAEPWDGANNRRLASRMPECFRPGRIRSPADRSNTSFVAIVGAGTAFPGSQSTILTDFDDGAGQTILLVEVADSGINWLEPRDLDAATMTFAVNDRSQPSISTTRPEGPLVAFAGRDTEPDYRRATPPALPVDFPPDVLRSLSTIRGGENLYLAEMDGSKGGLFCLGSGRATDADLARIQPTDRWTGLWLDHADVTDEAVSRVARASNLVRLSLARTSIGDEGIAALAPLARLRELDLSFTNVSDSGLPHLDRLAGLKSLSIRGARVTLPGLAKWLQTRTDASSFDEIEVCFDGGTLRGGILRLDPGPVAGEDLATLGELPRIEAADLRNTLIGDADLESIGGWLRLRRLNLAGTAISDEGLLQLAKLPLLAHLDLSRTHVSDRGLEHVARMTSLVHLDLGQTPITSAGLVSLSQLKSLESLVLRDTRLGGAGGESLTPLNGLRSLDLSGTAITGDDLQILLRNFPKLRDLDLSGTTIGDDSLPLLKSLQNLQRLRFNFTPVTDDGLEFLRELTGLVLLKLDGTKASPERIRTLLRSLPHLGGEVRD